MIVFEQLIEEASRMDTPVLEKLSLGVNNILEKRKAGSAAIEVVLLKKIKNIISPSIVRQYKRLHKKLQKNTITEKERQELIQITDYMEEKSAKRILLLGELAKLRKTSLIELMQQLDLKKLHEKA